MGGEAGEVLVIGGGAAGLCAAISARRAGARVRLIEAAPKSHRGGNSRHTRNFRCMHGAPLGVLSGAYDEAEYVEDLLKVTHGETDEDLARATIRRSQDCYDWLNAQGVRFQPALSGTLSLARTNAFFLGGGKAMLNALYRTAERLGVAIAYGTEARRLTLKEGAVAEVETSAGTLRPGAVVASSGGFQANLDWLARAWGPAARNFLIRGTPFNKGRVLRDLIDQGVAQVGDPTQCHAVAIDGRAPKFDGGIATRLDCVPFSVVVNRRGQRFYDEGEDVWPKRYAIWGRLVAGEPDQVAYAIIDARAVPLFMPSVFPPERADTIGGLAAKLGLEPARLEATVAAYNAACPDEAGFRPGELDGLATRGLSPPKSNWARPIVEPPFHGYPLRTGVTFTYLGVKVGADARVALADGGRARNLWAAGEIMAGSILGRGYLAGFGLAIGMSFGRVAGEEAAAHVL